MGTWPRDRALRLFAGASDDAFGSITAGAVLQRFPAGAATLMEGVSAQRRNGLTAPNPG